MAKPLIVTLKIAPWFHVYVLGLRLSCWVTGREPDPLKVKYWLRKASTITTNSTKSKAL